MSYYDWSNAQYDVFDNTPGVLNLRNDWEYDFAAEQYEIGFTIPASEYDEYGIDRDDVRRAREAFFDFLEIDDSQFDWDAWRESIDTPV